MSHYGMNYRGQVSNGTKWLYCGASFNNPADALLDAQNAARINNISPANTRVVGWVELPDHTRPGHTWSDKPRTEDGKIAVHTRRNP